MNYTLTYITYMTTTWLGHANEGDLAEVTYGAGTLSKKKIVSPSLIGEAANKHR